MRAKKRFRGNKRGRSLYESQKKIRKESAASYRALKAPDWCKETTAITDRNSWGVRSRPKIAEIQGVEKVVEKKGLYLCQGLGSFPRI